MPSSSLTSAHVRPRRDDLAVLARTFSATAAWINALNASASSVSPSRMSMARRLLPSRPRSSALNPPLWPWGAIRVRTQYRLCGLELVALAPVKLPPDSPPHDKRQDGGSQAEIKVSRMLPFVMGKSKCDGYSRLW